MGRSIPSVIFLISLLAACSNSEDIQSNPTKTTASDIVIESTRTLFPTLTPTPQPPPSPGTFGPDQFPQGYNPLAGQRVADPSSLNIPAILVSISHFPPVARPQAGFSFAQFVYEFFITEGATRHLTVFYGDFPKPDIPIHGDCEIRKEPFTQTGNILGNRVWYDANQNGIQDPGEGGVGGVCVDLYDTNNKLIQQTTTDSNGYYGFKVEAGKYIIEFEKPASLEFTQKNVGDEGQDSDADQATDRTDALDVTSTLLYWDAGLTPSRNITPTPDASAQLPIAEVGPIRSGRLVYRFIGAFYPHSCLVYASADEQVLSQIPICAIVPHTTAEGGAMLPLTRMKEIAGQISEDQPKINYTGNLFSDEPPAGGVPATELREYWAYLNQSKWVYDSASEAWWRYVDESNKKTAGIVHPEVDRLNGRQLMFDNIVVLFAEHIVDAPTIVDIDLQVGNLGNAFLFRSGKMYRIRWSTRTGTYEQKTGLRRPIQFMNLDGTPAALKPGHTWVIILSTQSYLEDHFAGQWLARFIAPAGAK